MEVSDELHATASFIHDGGSGYATGCENEMRDRYIPNNGMIYIAPGGGGASGSQRTGGGEIRKTTNK
jgi:hypothetical protein